jgi:transcriptional regulator with XRE-family HTH domain
MRIAQKFEVLLNEYRHPDGHRWTGQDLYDATGGVVTRSYVTNLRKGRIQNPGYEKLRAIAKAMGFPPEIWFEEIIDPGVSQLSRVGGGANLSVRTNALFETIEDPRTGEPYSNAEVARMSLGRLTEKAIEDIRTGRESNPPVEQISALADVFAIHPYYFLTSGKSSLVLDEKVLTALADETTKAILLKVMGLSRSERNTILGIVQQFESVVDTNEGS